MESFFSMWKVRELADKVTNVVMNYTEIEAKVREATNDEAWGPTGALMQELAHATFTYEHFPEVMSMLWKRMLQESKQNWRRTYKSLLVLNYLIKNGSERVVTSAREHIYDLRSLENYTFIDENGKDQGVNIRHKVKELIEFAQDDDRLREERKKAKKNKDKYIGMSSDMMGMKFGSSSEKWDDRPYRKTNDFGGNNWDDNSNNRYRDKSFDDDVEGENIDSDDESSPRGRTKSRDSANRYKDEGGPGSPTAAATTYLEKKVNLSLNSNIATSPKKIIKPLKKVDLGAAANFGRDSSQSPLPRPPSGGPTGDLLDDFDPRAGEKGATSVNNEFGDFEAAFNNSTITQAPVVVSSQSEDDFADFSSAFSNSNSTAPSSLLTSPTTPTVLPNIIPPNMGVSKQNKLLEGPFSGENLLEGFSHSGSGAVMGHPAPQALLTSQVSSLPKKNDDLLGDLSDFDSMSIAPKPVVSNIVNNNFNDPLTGGPGLLDNFGDRTRVKLKTGRRRKSTLETNLEEVTIQVIEQLSQMSKITSQADIEYVLELLDNLVKNYPIALDVHKLQDLEEGFDYRAFAENHYSILLESVIKLFDQNFPFREGQIYGSVVNFFLAEDPIFFYVCLQVLTKNIKHKENTVPCLQILLECEGLFAAIVSSALRIVDDWSDTVRTLISLPNRVANVMQRNTPVFFSNQRYSYLLIYNVLKSIEFLAMITYKDPQVREKINLGNLSLFLEQIIVHFNERNNCDGLAKLIEIVACLTNKPSEKLGLYQGLWYRILENLDRSAVEVFAKACLTQIDPKKYCIKRLLGRSLVKNDVWKYVLCTKLPLLTFVNQNHHNYVINLVLYLGCSTHSDLVALLRNLTSVWCDKSAIKRTSVEQHLLVSKFIVCIISCLQQIGLSKHEERQLESKVHHGLSAHLESAVEAIKYSGMKTGEIFLNFIHENDEQLTENRLKFEYDNLSAEIEAIVKEIEYFASLDFEQLYKPKSHFDVDIEAILQELHGGGGTVHQYMPPERKFRSRKFQKQPANEIILVKPKRNLGITIIDENLELDSDDEFEPYDLSNDVNIPDKRPPAYLRDLRECLLETEDPEVFASALNTCEQLIIHQLPDDDSSIGLELLEILIALDSKFCVENFEKLVFESCVAITCVYPAIYADYLCKEIHCEMGKYSTVHRILMLDILRQASKTLSSITVPEAPGKPKKTKPTVSSASEVIRQRLESKTRYFHTHRVLKYEQKNKFADVAGHFFFPLIYGYTQNKLLSQPVTKINDDFLLLIHFIETLAMVIFNAQNCLISLRMAKEALHFSWFLRFHKDVKVRMAVLNLIAASVMVVPQTVLIQDFMNELFEMRLWLADLLNPNVDIGEPNEECRRLAACTIVLIENVLKIDVDEEE
ncbi:telomere length regulation protein TEL2 homolog [Euwallacea fornicatus]|uniref:telomere length regulation protein TEL2 homolog n=1 Tax=Euwallacea fornicatus TaxID=995702 RepID=UPI00338E1FB6